MLDYTNNDVVLAARERIIKEYEAVGRPAPLPTDEHCITATLLDAKFQVTTDEAISDFRNVAEHWKMKYYELAKRLEELEK